MTGKDGYQGSRHPAWRVRVLLLCMCVTVTLFIVYLYALLLYASLVLAFGANNTPTLNNYRVIFTEGLPAIKDTLIIALLGMPLGGLYGVVVGYLVSARVRRPPGDGNRLMINYALPGTIVGIAYLIAFNDKPFALTGTAPIIIACYVFRYSPDWNPHHHRVAAADRSQHRGSILQPRRGQLHHLPAWMLPLVLPAFFAGLRWSSSDR